MNNLSENKKKVLEGIESVAPRRNRYIKRSNYYYRNLVNFFRFNIPAGTRVLEIGCGTGYLLNALKPSYGMGIDLSPSMISMAQQQHPHLSFRVMDAENLELDEKFDYVILSDTLGYLEDIQVAFQQLRKVIHPGTRILISYHNFLWEPALWLVQKLGLKMPHRRLNWLGRGDVINLLELEGFDVVKSGKRFLFPVNIPVISWFLNKYVAYLPLFNSLCLTGYIIARLPETRPADNKDFSVSVIIPARNEKGNIEDAVLRTPEMGKHTEILFVEGNSTDDTLDEIKRVC